MSGLSKSVGTYVGVGTNRAGHSARTAKAAQRTPLPPKAGTEAAERWASKPNSAAQVIEDTIAAARAAAARLREAREAETAAEAATLVEPAAEAPVAPADKPAPTFRVVRDRLHRAHCKRISDADAPEISEADAAEVLAAGTQPVQCCRARVDVAFHRKIVTERQTSAASEPAPVAAPAPQPQAADEALPPKVAAYAESAREFGWPTTISFNKANGSHSVVSARGTETITVVFTDGHWNPDGSLHTFRRADGTCARLRNASAAKKQMTTSGSERPIVTTRSSRPASRKPAEPEVPQRALPVGFLDLDDAALVRAIRSGVKIVWRAKGSRESRESIVHRGDRVSVVKGPAGQRAVLVAGAHGRAVSIALGNVLRVESAQG